MIRWADAPPSPLRICPCHISFARVTLRTGLTGVARLPARPTEGFNMIRWSVLAAGTAVVVGAAFVTGASIPPKPSVGVGKGAEVKATVIGQKTGYFNMPRIMREYRRAQTAMVRINERTTRALVQVKGMREMYADLQKKHETTLDAEQKDRIKDEMLALKRMIEDFDREHGKRHTEQAAFFISEIYADIRTATAEMAHEHGLVAVLTYPDAATREEAESPLLKEMKLKPTACSPFYLDPSVDYTDELVHRLNAKAEGNRGK
ncbi:MAG: hypothetical protein C0467_17030 [Planctomycetaceae bacterium]|nr:hypothetical protein [Planctomycetaceae bacterium]